MDSDNLAFLSLIIVAMISIYAGVSGTLGYRRQTYILPHYYSGGINYASLPGGVACLFWAIMGIIPLPELWANTLGFLGMGFGLLGLLFNFVQPAFLTPHWYRWLKSQHGDIMPWLRQDMESMGYSEWKERTKTITELEDWAIDVRKRYRWEIEAVKKNGGFPQ